MDPDSNRRPAARRRGGGARRAVGRGLRVSVSDGRGRAVRDGGLSRWLEAAAPPRARGDVAVALVSNAHITRLNRQYRHTDTPTDVLSFPFEPSGTGSPGSGSRPEHAHLGDIVIATAVARRQARESGHSYATELRVLALHGLLHLLGYDHDARDDDGRMARIEAGLRRRAGLPGGLIERAGAASRPSGRGRPRARTTNR